MADRISVTMSGGRMAQASHAIKPRARSHNLLVSEVKGETLVYDEDVHKAHTLSPTTALIWRHCDGQKTVPELATMVNGELGMSLDEDGVWLALSRLERAKLLSERVAVPSHLRGDSRRQFMKKMAVAGAATVTVMSMAVPTSLAAQSCVLNAPGCIATGPGLESSRCSSGAQCCSCCCQSFGSEIQSCHPEGDCPH